MRRRVSSMAMPSPEGSSCMAPGSRRARSLGSSVGMEMLLSGGNPAALGPVPQLSFVGGLHGGEAPKQRHVVDDLESAGDDQRPAERSRGEEPAGDERRHGAGEAARYGREAGRR